MPRQSTKVARVCTSCDATFWVYPSTLRQYPALTCSIRCRVAPKHPVMYVGGDVAYVPLCKRDGTIVGYATIDAADGEWLSQYQWGLSGGYARRTKRTGDTTQTIRMHREILGLADDGEVDHIDRNRSNNRRENLRVGTRATNMQNRTPFPDGVSVHRGVTFDRRWGGTWIARVIVNREQRYYGRFKSEDAAAIAVREARARLMPYATD